MVVSCDLTLQSHGGPPPEVEVLEEVAEVEEEVAEVEEEVDLVAEVEEGVSGYLLEELTISDQNKLVIFAISSK